MTAEKENHRQRKRLHNRNQLASLNKQLINRCQNFECPGGDEQHVNIIQPPPYFQIRPPPSPLGFLSFKDSLYTIDLSKTSCEDPSPFLLDPIKSKSGNEEQIFKFHKPVKDNEKFYLNTASTIRLNNKTATTKNIIISNTDTSILSFILVFGTSLLFVLFLCMILYMCFAKKVCFANTKCKKRKSSNQGQNSSSSLSQSSYAQSNSLMRNFRNEQLNHQPTEFSHFIPTNPTSAEAFKSHEDNQIAYLKTIQAINRNALNPPSNMYMSYDNDQSQSCQKRSFKKKDSVRSLISSKTEKSKKKKQPFFKNSTMKTGKSLQMTETCACSTLSTRATNESSSSTSSTSSPKSSTSPNINPTNNQYEANNHYQRLLFKNNSILSQQYDQAAHISNYMLNNNVYVPNKVALLCNTDSNMPQLIKVMDIKELNDYVQILNTGN